MAQKRMFSLKIVDTDAFLDMPQGSQLLYFHLAMRADDDGFVSNPKKIMKISNSADDDMKVLVAKEFIIPFERGVCVIKHWLVHNIIRQDRYIETEHIEEKNKLALNKGKYEIIENVLPLGNQMAPQIRLDKIRLDKNSIADKSAKKTKFSSLGGSVLKSFEEIDPKNKTYYNNKTQRSACDFLIEEYGLDKVLQAIKILPQINTKKLYIKQITTPYELKENWIKIGNALKQQKNDKNQPNYVL